MNDVRFGRDWVQKLDHLRNITGIVGLVIGLAFAAVAVVIIGVTIRLTLLQRAREISIMRLVGATNWFIRGPFLLEGALKGLLGGCCRWCSATRATCSSATRAAGRSAG